MGRRLLAAWILVARAAKPEGGAWLSETPLPTWNQRGVSVPAAVKAESPADPRCAEAARPPASKDDRAVVSGGWSLVGAVQVFAGARAFLATSSYDGMCRPFDYQGFVFLEGRLAGVLAPSPMRSRTDGSLLGVRLLSETSLEAEFARYFEQDPLCCPSREIVVRYRIETGEAGPLLVAERATAAPR